jgi:hypothetical protein
MARVAVAIVNVVGVLAMLDSLMAAASGVSMGVRIVCGVGLRCALVPVPPMLAVRVSVVPVVGVVAMRDRCVATSGSMLVLVIAVLSMLGFHRTYRII